MFSVHAYYCYKERYIDDNVSLPGISAGYLHIFKRAGKYWHVVLGQNAWLCKKVVTLSLYMCGALGFYRVHTGLKST